MTRRLARSGLLAVLLLAGACTPSPTPSVSAHAAHVYQCPMHPQVVSSEPGTCPLCGMTLVERAPAAAPTHVYQCPMHPQVVSHEPGTCPLCGMTLVERSPAAASRAPVEVDPVVQAKLGMRTVPVDLGPVRDPVWTTARVAVDETRVRQVSLRFSGYVEHVAVDFVGQPVTRGQTLFTVYSPEVLAAEQEYVAAREAHSPLAQATRRKLELWNVPPRELERLARTASPSATVAVSSPWSGVVTRKAVVEGAHLEAGAVPYELTDLSTVWVLADVAERDLPRVTPGLRATVRLPAFPGQTWTGEVRFVDPVVSPTTRTARARIALPNPGGALRPESVAEVLLEAPLEPVLRVPASAVVRGGQHDVVFVSTDDSHFEPREVTVGEVGRDFIEVRGGVTAGERVLASATFFVDSEARLQASLAQGRR